MPFDSCIMMKTFASDNAAGVHPAIMDAMIAANKGHALAYGRDEYTERARTKFRDHFGNDAETYFVFGGAGANITGIKAALREPYSIVCPDGAHIYESECGAPRTFTGCSFIPVGTRNGKLRVSGVREASRDSFGLISISQPTELGTVYEPGEIEELASYAHDIGAALHMDGARICNAADYLGMSLCGFTRDAGVDVVSFGGTKNGIMYGEAVVILNPKFAQSENGKIFDDIRVEAAQRPSKMRYVAAQFDALLTDDLWMRNARHSNAMAKTLYRAVQDVPKVELTQPIQSNAVFATIPRECIAPLREKYFFEVWDEETGEVRWMTAWDTTHEDVMDFAGHIREIVK